MKFEMARNSLFAILLRKPWWVSAATALAIVGLARLVLPPAWFIYGAAGAFPFIVIACIAGWREVRAPGAARVTATVDAVRAMAWPEFSAAIEAAWRRDGWTITRIDETGADFEVSQGWRRGLVACKRWKAARTGIEPLRELHAARERREVHDCIYVVLGEISDQAVQFAEKNRIRLVTGSELARMMPTVGRAAKPALKRSPG
jgi:restriction system protein